MGLTPQEMMQHAQPTPQPVNYYSDASTTNDLTGGLPINLDSLRDGPPGSKPFYPYSTLIRYVFLSLLAPVGPEGGSEVLTVCSGGV